MECVGEEDTPARTIRLSAGEREDEGAEVGRCFSGWGKPWRREGSPGNGSGAESVHFNLSVCTQASEQQHYLAIGLLMPNFQPTSRSEVVEDILTLRVIHFA